MGRTFSGLTEILDGDGRTGCPAGAARTAREGPPTGDGPLVPLATLRPGPVRMRTTHRQNPTPA
ncbi:hypothetical protein [Streptomyces sp. NPDC051567]|uniref:hypothetical protein n=1 Tax=Streptomyces sp. NPDC051567 TaxID=3365660 RepID=UPI00378E939F